MSCVVRPTSINILGVKYSIEYLDKPSEVDLFKRQSLWGQIDYWTRSIRVYDKERSSEDLWWTIWHEVLHGIVEALKIKVLNDKEDEIDLLALAITDVLFRNGIMVEPTPCPK
ncbi:hypothetical protein KKE60_05415 [Patescibacteria group bacterium]|nr:hypothetical protein [Patescibacteria group bacterium]